MPHLNPAPTDRKSRTANVLLWVCQGLLAALFLFAGISKLRMPAEVLAQQVQLPGAFLRFIAVAEVAGALGLVLPGLLRVRKDLTPVAAVGLLTIMSGATTLSLVRFGAAAAALPLVTGVLLAVVARGRASWTANRAAARRPVVDLSILGSLIRRVG